MNKNIGNQDRLFRIVVALISAVLFFTKTITGTLGWVVLGAGVILLATALFRFCPLYALLGVKTCKN